MIQPPKPATLRRYGLSEDEWRAIGDRQGWVCPICGRCSPAVTLVIDHEHRKGWKRLPPRERKRAVRGLLCGHCNHRLLGRFVTLARSLKVVEYLRAFEAAQSAWMPR